MFQKLFIAALLIAAFLTTPPAVAEKIEAKDQAVSKSMVECTVVFQVYGLRAKDQGKPDEMIGYFDKAAARFRDAALTRAGAEGIADPKQYVSDTYNALLPKWREKYTALTEGSMVEVTTETKDIMDWVNYCGSLGRKINILPLTAE